MARLIGNYEYRPSLRSWLVLSLFVATKVFEMGVNAFTVILTLLSYPVQELLRMEPRNSIKIPYQLLHPSLRTS